MRVKHFNKFETYFGERFAEVDASHQSFQNVHLGNNEWVLCDLSNYDFLDAQTPRQVFSSCILTNTKFTNSNLNYSFFLNSNMCGVDFTNATLNGVWFQNLDLTQAVLINIKINEFTLFDRVKLLQSQLIWLELSTTTPFEEHQIKGIEIVKDL